MIRVCCVTEVGASANPSAVGSDGCAPGKPLFDKGAYFIGKAVWGKGYSELLERLAEQKAVRDGNAMPIDIFGTGEDLEEACPQPYHVHGNCTAALRKMIQLPSAVVH